MAKDKSFEPPVAGDTAAATDPSEEPGIAGAPDAVEPPEIAALKRERDDFYDRFLRKSAEFENYRKRIDRERREQADQTVVDLLRELLLVVDDFDLALNVEAPEGADAYKKGVELIHTKLHDVLRKYGVRPIDALGSDFDPNFHQAVLHEVSADHRDGEVIDELRRGYMLGDRLLRPSLVKVAKQA
jgi:molecular chaperone GrpE